MNDIKLIEFSNPNKLTILLNENKISQSMLADELGISRQLVHHYCKGTRSMDTQTVVNIAKFFGVDVDDVIGERCLFCGEWLKTKTRYTDRFGNSTQKMKSLDKDIHSIYDCHNCGYVEISNRFYDDFNDDVTADSSDYHIIQSKIIEHRDRFNLQWYDLITVGCTDEIGDADQYRFELSTSFSKHVFEVTPDWNEERDDYETVTIKESSNVNEEKLKEFNSFKRFNPKSEKIDIFLYESEKSFIQIAEGYYLGRKTGSKAVNDIMVLKGSKMIKTNKLIKPQSKKKRDEILKDNSITETDDYYVLEEDISFTSPSLAAAVLLGKECRGTILWKDMNDVTLYDIFNK